jgi:outer membrane protein OmpA-like peptidoglycan-associated protein
LKSIPLTPFEHSIKLPGSLLLIGVHVMMRLVLYGLFLLFAVVVSGLSFWRDFNPLPQERSGKQLALASANNTPAAPSAVNNPPLDRQRTGPSDFDVALVDPNGPSVFAGKALPHSWVTVLADGVPVGSVEADADGEWSLVVDKRLPASPKLAVTVGPKPSAPNAARVAASEQREPTPGGGSDAKAVGQDVINRLEALVASKRNQQADAWASAQNSPIDQPRMAEPVPILFRFREAEFTDEGRRAVQLLLDYLRLTHVNAVTLTGHADERGTDALNFDLSDQRLRAVAAFLRRGSYAGRLELQPKGKSEPFRGIDRSKYAQEVLWQLDRRVELIAQHN